MFPTHPQSQSTPAEPLSDRDSSNMDANSNGTLSDPQSLTDVADDADIHDETNYLSRPPLGYLHSPADISENGGVPHDTKNRINPNFWVVSYDTSHTTCQIV
jgi:hypothetical protein